MARGRTKYGINEVLSIHMQDCLKHGRIKSGHTVTGTIEWSADGKPCGAISYESKSYQGVGDFRLIYKTSIDGGEKTIQDYTVKIRGVKSNLGSGYVLYFICPITRQRCRSLYVSGSGFISYQAHVNRGTRLYYDSQACSKLGHTTAKLRQSERLLKRFEDNPKRINRTYRGKPTRRALELSKLRTNKFQAEWDNDIFIEDYCIRKGWLHI